MLYFNLFTSLVYRTKKGSVMLSRFDLNLVKLQSESQSLYLVSASLACYVYIKVGPSKNIVIKESLPHRRNQCSSKQDSSKYLMVYCSAM